MHSHGAGQQDCSGGWTSATGLHAEQRGDIRSGSGHLASGSRHAYCARWSWHGVCQHLMMLPMIKLFLQSWYIDAASFEKQQQQQQQHAYVGRRWRYGLRGVWAFRQHQSMSRKQRQFFLQVFPHLQHDYDGVHVAFHCLYRLHHSQKLTITSNAISTSVKE